MSGRGLANPTINKRLQCINAFLVWCVERGELDRKPRIRLLKTDRRMPGRLTGEQLQALFDRIAMGPSRPENQWSYRLHHRFLTVAAATGARRAEIFWLPWARIDFKREVIYVQKSKRMQVKERKDKTLPMPPRFRDYLLCERESYPGEVWLLDNGRGDLFYNTPGGISRAFSRHYAALGIKGVKPIHGLRASFGDYLLNVLQLPISDVQRWLGHEYETTTLLYASDEGGRLRKAPQSIGSLSPVTPPCAARDLCGKGREWPATEGLNFGFKTGTKVEQCKSEIL